MSVKWSRWDWLEVVLRFVIFPLWVGAMVWALLEYFRLLAGK
jgi:hypothetical protein